MPRAQANAIKIEVTDLETNITTIYTSIGEAARALEVRQTAISQYFLKNQKTPYKGKYLFKKIGS